MNEIITILKMNSVILDAGLTEIEIEQLERKYKIKFPAELKELYKEALPVSKGFYNWREALTDENTDKFEKILNKPFLELKEQIEEIEWNEAWGEKPDSNQKIKEIIISKINHAPKLIPIFRHLDIGICAPHQMKATP